MRKVLKILLILMICIALVPHDTHAITLGEYEAQLQKYKDDAAANQAALNKTEAEIAETNRQIENTKNEIKNLANEVTKLKEEIVQFNEEIKEKSLQTKELFQYFQMSNGENAYLEYAFGAETVTDLIYRMAIVEQMTEYNEKVTKELETMIKANQTREEEIKEINKDLEVKQKELEEKVVSLGNTKSSLTVGGASIQDQIKNYEEKVTYYRNKGCSSNDVIGVDCAVSASSGVFRRPVSVGYITSEFGNRGGSFHRGLDISNGDPYNTKIYPVANGTISSIWQDLYGALIVTVEHYESVSGTYYTSMYAHLNSYAPNIYVGKYVTSDDYLGYMGNTGYSTGPHLHMEIAPCRLYLDSACYTWDSYTNFVRNQSYNGFKGPRQLINFPSGTYNAWYTR